MRSFIKVFIIIYIIKGDNMLKLIFGVELRINLKKDYSHVDFKNSDEDLGP